MHSRWLSRALIAAVSLIVIGSTAACSTGGGSSAGQGHLTPIGAASPLDPSASPGAPSTAPATTLQPTTPVATQVGPTAHATATVTALSASYRGLCAPPADATTFRAVITVHGVTAGHPVTVHWRWRTSHGGDSDPSLQSHTFTTSGSYTTMHHESAYPSSPYPKVLNDWAAVVVSGAGPTITSSHAAYTINCLPWVAVLSGTSTTYSGTCPPSLTALTFSVQISVSYPMAITYHWHTSNGGDSDPTPHTVNVVPGASFVVTHSETSYTPGATTSDNVQVAVTGAGLSGDSNSVGYTETCTAA